MEESDLPKFDSGLLDLDLEGFSSLFNTPEEEDFGGTEDFCNDGHDPNEPGDLVDTADDPFPSGLDSRPSTSLPDAGADDVQTLVPTDTTGAITVKTEQAVATRRAAAAAGSSKPTQLQRRRRRNRTAKQQELNRLAQQRYRERKKQKYSNLQGTVEELSEQLHQLALLREAHSAVSSERDQLAAVVGQQRDQLTQQAGVIAVQQQQMGAQAAQLAAANQQLAEARQQVGALTAQVAELRTRAAPTADELSEQLALAVKAALAASTLGAGNNGSPVAGVGSAQGEREEARVRQVVCGLPERVLQQFMASCREVVRHLHQPEPAEGLQAIQVPCC